MTKMKASGVILSMILCLFLMGCDDGYTRLESGIAYKMIEDVDGRKAQFGDIMMIDFKSVYGGDSILAERTAESGFFMDPFRGVPTNMKDVLDQVDEGDSIHLKFTLMEYALLTRMVVPRGMDTTKNVIMQMRIAEVENESTIIARVQEEQKEIDQELIEQYLANNNLTAEITPEGLYYIITEEGKGPLAQRGQTISVNYELMLIDGTYVDTTFEEIAKEQGIWRKNRVPYQPYSVEVETGNAIPGWHIAMKLMRKGSKAKLLIPSRLGYQRRPKAGIPANSVMVYEIEVVDLK